jgi:hypothetical protein
MTAPTNQARTKWAGTALDAYRRETGCDTEDSLTDLLADLMHWCDRSDVDFAATLHGARGHYDVERTEGDAA